MNSNSQKLLDALPFIIIIVGCLFFIALWRSLLQDENDRISHKSQEVAYQLINNWQYNLSQHILALKRIDKRMGFYQTPSLSQWDLDAGEFLKDVSAYQAIAWIQPSNNKFWPLIKKNSPSPEQLTHQLQTCYKSTRNSLQLTAQVKSKIVSLNLENFCIVTYSSKSILVALLSSSAFFRDVSNFFQPSMYQIFLNSGSLWFNLSLEKKTLLPASWQKKILLSDFEQPVYFVLWPTQHLLSTNRSIYPIFFFFIGLILTFFLALSVYFWNQSQKKAHALLEEIAEHQKVESRFKAITNSAKDAIIVSDAKGRVTFWNQMATKMFGYTRQEAVGHPVQKLVIPKKFIHKYKKIFLNLREANNENGLEKTFEIPVHRKDGSEFMVEISISSLFSKGKRETAAIVRDITERKKNEALIYHQANYDLLTDLPNRLLFEDRIKDAIRSSDRTGFSTALVLIDIDNFKMINDLHGHIAGDELLKQVSKNLHSSIRNTDTIARIGGDEFVAILTNIKNKEETRPIVDKIKQACSIEYTILGQKTHCFFSMGVAFYPENAHQLEDLIQRADVAMYQAKRAGKNQIYYA